MELPPPLIFRFLMYLSRMFLPQEFVSVSAESVVVHDHNLSDQSLHNCVQKGLTFEVRLLVGAAASGLDDFLFRGFLDGFTEEALDVGGVV